MPASIETELEFWRGATKRAGDDDFIFPSTTGTAIRTDNFLFRVLKKAGRDAGIKGVNHQMLRRTCSTFMAQLTTVKDVQAHLRHANAATTLEHYIKSVPASVQLQWSRWISCIRLYPKQMSQGTEVQNGFDSEPN